MDGRPGVAPLCRLATPSTYNPSPMPKTTKRLPPMAAAMAAQADAAAELLKTLGNPQRLRILCLLVEGEHSVGEINAHVPLSQSALSQHLALLREQGLVETRREAQTIFYALVDGPARAMLGTLHDLYCPTPEAAAPKPRQAAKAAPRRKVS
jgi:ArsR family transcriptional regulator, virulence genes transcriptional regulator